MKLLSLFLRIYFFAKFALVFPLYIYASSGIVRTFDTHTASVHVRICTTIVFSSNVGSFQQARLILSSWRSTYARTWMSISLCAAHAYRNDRRKYTVAAGIYRVFSIATDACCYAARATLSRFRLLRFSNFCLPLPPSFLPPSHRVVPPLLTKKRFSPFLPRDRALTLSPT